MRWSGGSSPPAAAANSIHATARKSSGGIPAASATLMTIEATAACSSSRATVHDTRPSGAADCDRLLPKPETISPIRPIRETAAAVFSPEWISGGISGSETGSVSFSELPSSKVPEMPIVGLPALSISTPKFTVPVGARIMQPESTVERASAARAAAIFRFMVRLPVSVAPITVDARQSSHGLKRLIKLI